jgi:hypothetical protein
MPYEPDVARTLQRVGWVRSWPWRFQNYEMSATAVELLTLVQAYCQVHEEADEHLQEAVWNLTKARRASRSFAALPSISTDMTAASVRHDLSARTAVVAVVDDRTSLGVTSCFRCFDPKLPPPPNQCDDGSRQHDEDDDGIMVVDGGLRHRKGKTKTAASLKATEKTMVMDSPGSIDKVVSAKEESLMILGGSLPPRDLRVAQERARKSLDEYVRAATLVAALQQRLRQASQ